jgi:hypothetical protein
MIDQTRLDESSCKTIDVFKMQPMGKVSTNRHSSYISYGLATDGKAREELQTLTLTSMVSSRLMRSHKSNSIECVLVCSTLTLCLYTTRFVRYNAGGFSPSQTLLLAPGIVVLGSFSLAPIGGQDNPKMPGLCWDWSPNFFADPNMGATGCCLFSIIQ